MYSIKEKIISATESASGVIHAKATSHNINLGFLITLLIGIVGISSIYAATIPAEKSQLQICQESYMKATNEIVKYNTDNPKYKIPLPNYDCNNQVASLISSDGTHSTGITVPPPRITGGPTISIENHYQKEPTIETCSDFKMKKVRGVVIHYTGADEKSASQVEKNHTNRWKLTTYTSAYHYLIEKDGKIVRPRSETCGSLALGEDATVDNQETINVTYIGSGKPTEAQVDSLVYLVRDIQNRYGLPRDYVTAHADIQSKNHKESMEGMFGSKAEFVKKLRIADTITIYGKESPELTYMWQAWGDTDFIGTIFQESRMNNTTIGDGGQSIGYCQIHKGYQPGWYAEYSKLKTMEERLNYCHEKYTYAKGLEGGVGSRFHGYNVRTPHINAINIY